jgi:hypothetical protein
MQNAVVRPLFCLLPTAYCLLLWPAKGLQRFFA